MNLDGIGVHGNFLHYALVIFLVSSAFVVFLYLWKNKRLDMDEGPKYQMMEEETDDHVELYGDPGIASYHGKVPLFLIVNYIVWPIWGIFAFYYFWNGSLVSWMDPGYWRELQIAANTTFPIENQNSVGRPTPQKANASPAEIENAQSR